MNFDKIVCPISGKRVSVNVPRLNALFVIGLLAVYLVADEVWIMGLLVLDFAFRASGKEKYSLIFRLSGMINKTVFAKDKRTVDVSPKIFAARLGLFVTALVLAFHLIGLYPVAFALAMLLIVFASLECFLNFCVGCWIFTLFVKPFYT